VCVWREKCAFCHAGSLRACMGGVKSVRASCVLVWQSLVCDWCVRVGHHALRSRVCHLSPPGVLRPGPWGRIALRAAAVAFGPILLPPSHMRMRVARTPGQLSCNLSGEARGAVVLAVGRPHLALPAGGMLAPNSHGSLDSCVACAFCVRFAFVWRSCGEARGSWA
jgi:hypothetical protein